jgi:hypothetical protein
MGAVMKRSRGRPPQVQAPVYVASPIKRRRATKAEMPKPEPERQREQEPPVDLLLAWPLRWRDAIRFCMSNLDLLQDRDSTFVWEVNKYSHIPSERQLAWLRNCVERCRQRGAKS